MDHLAAILFLAQLTATLLMTGLIWFVQIVHYPLFASVGEPVFVVYARHHAHLTGYVVGGPMLIELGTALAALIPGLRPPFFSTVPAWTSAALVLLLWATTGLLQVPQHERLGQTRDVRVIRHLVRGNWIRTILWSIRSILLLACLSHAL